MILPPPKFIRKSICSSKKNKSQLCNIDFYSSKTKDIWRGGKSKKRKKCVLFITFLISKYSTLTHMSTSAKHGPLQVKKSTAWAVIRFYAK